MENVLKQQVLDLQADRMRTHHLASNQLRLWLATFAYLLLKRLRALTLQGSVRRVHMQRCSAFPLQNVFRICRERFMNLPQNSG
jgi:hypothetical protein